MKKAKLIVASVVMLAVVGGALAFKAKALFPTPNVYCHQASDDPGKCSQIVNFQDQNNAINPTQDPCGDQSSYAVGAAGDCTTTQTVYATDVVF